MTVSGTIRPRRKQRRRLADEESEFITARDGQLIEITLYLLLYARIGFLSPNPSRIMHLSGRCYRPLRTAHWGIETKSCLPSAAYEKSVFIVSIIIVRIFSVA